MCEDLWVYILTNERRTTLYIGITNDLARRVYEHRTGRGSGFTRKYNLHVLLHHEHFPDPLQAIAREKQLKNWNRVKKEWLIAQTNPEWRDLAPDILGG